MTSSRLGDACLLTQDVHEGQIKYLNVLRPRFTPGMWIYLFSAYFKYTGLGRVFNGENAIYRVLGAVH